MPITNDNANENDSKFEITNCTYSNVQIKDERDEIEVTVSQNSTTETPAASSYMTWENYLPIHKELTDLIESRLKEISEQINSQVQSASKPAEDSIPSRNEVTPEIRNENLEPSTTDNVVPTTSNHTANAQVPETRNSPVKKSVVITLENTNDVEQINIVVNFKSSNEQQSTSRLNTEPTTVINIVNNEHQTTNNNETSTTVNRTVDVPVPETNDTQVVVKDATERQEIIVPTLEENTNNTSNELKSDSGPTVTNDLEEPPQITLESTTNEVSTKKTGTERKRKPRKCAENKTSNSETQKKENKSRKRTKKEPVTESNEIPKKKLPQPKKPSNRQKRSSPNQTDRSGRPSGVSNGIIIHRRVDASRRTIKSYGDQFPTLSRAKTGVLTATEVAEFRHPSNSRQCATIKMESSSEDSDSNSSMNSFFDVSSSSN